MPLSENVPGLSSPKEKTSRRILRQHARTKMANSRLLAAPAMATGWPSSPKIRSSGRSRANSLAAPSKVEIKLPQSGELAIECDLPGKPPSQPVNIELKSFDGVHWNGDMLRFHVASTFMKNPGETVFEHLPPGQYSVQRNQSTKTGPSAYLITMADRQLVAVEPTSGPPFESTGKSADR